MSRRQRMILAALGLAAFLWAIGPADAQTTRRSGRGGRAGTKGGARGTRAAAARAVDTAQVRSRGAGYSPIYGYPGAYGYPGLYGPALGERDVPPDDDNVPPVPDSAEPAAPTNNTARIHVRVPPSA